MMIDIQNINIKRTSLNYLSNVLYNNIKINLKDSLRGFDDSLTCLNWLNNMNFSFETNSQWINDCYESKSASFFYSFPQKLQAALRSEGLFDESVRHEYKTSWTGKPPFSYTTLICMAMFEMGKDKIALIEIYEWIKDNFLHYRLSDSSWQNSVRHNLSLKKCFEKVPRRKDERGKGGFWRINSNYTDNFGSNLMKYRRQFQIYLKNTLNSNSQNNIKDLIKHIEDRNCVTTKSLYSTQTNNISRSVNSINSFSFSKPLLSIPENNFQNQFENKKHDVSQPKNQPSIKRFKSKQLSKLLLSLNHYTTIEVNKRVTTQITKRTPSLNLNTFNKNNFIGGISKCFKSIESNINTLEEGNYFLKDIAPLQNVLTSDCTS